MRRWSSERERAGATQGESGPVSRQRPENAQSAYPCPKPSPGRCPRLRYRQVRVLLPRRCREWAMPSVPLDRGAEWLLLIYDDAPDIETVIAHEVAHAYLGHSITDPLMPHEETERQARDLVRSWVSPAKGPITDRDGSRRGVPVLSPALRTPRFAGCFDSFRGHFRATASLFPCRVAPCPRLGSRIPAQAWHPPARAGSS